MRPMKRSAREAKRAPNQPPHPAHRPRAPLAAPLARPDAPTSFSQPPMRCERLFPHVRRAHTHRAASDALARARTAHEKLFRSPPRARTHTATRRVGLAVANASRALSTFKKLL